MLYFKNWTFLLISGNTQYSVLFKKVKELQKEGKLSQRKIAKKLGMNRDVVGRYFKLDVYPRNFSEPIYEKKYSSFIRKLWKNGERSAKEIWRKIKEK
ncbi:hypothetical protein EI427_25545 (plasmid) [Flammeovirga pectinis]|uniref:Uncharacterized protein n=1 Tax=Flammeovirga pectinis TaxID=2494373 RepID=A0A3Q9FVP6_9BACT|nr:hypothetical protein EI427_25545 [Flammeovirga pectinis]